MKKSNIIIIALILCFSCLSASAQTKKQYNKPLQSGNAAKTSTDARYNVGITGGGTLTEWIHLGGSNTHFRQPILSSIGVIGGVAVERVINKSTTIGIEGLYAIRQTELSHTLEHFPTAIDVWDNIDKQFNVNYTEIAIQAPFSIYLNNTANAPIRPYVFAAPRFTLPLSGTMRWQRQYANDSLYHPSLNQDTTINMSSKNFKPYNIGLVLGGGVLLRINMNNYYFLVKVDASYHVGFINTHTKNEIESQINGVIGSNYIEPKLLEKRFSTDANLKLSLFFPLKKQLKGACMKWGEYD